MKIYGHNTHNLHALTHPIHSPKLLTKGTQPNLISTLKHHTTTKHNTPLINNNGVLDCKGPTPRLQVPVMKWNRDQSPNFPKFPWNLYTT